MIDDTYDYVYGLTTAQDYTTKYQLGYFHNATEFYYPGDVDAFDGYVREYNWTGENLTMGGTTDLDHSILPDDFEGHEKSFSISDGVITYTATGDGYDAVNLSVESEYHNWYFLVPLGEISAVPVLSIPDALSAYDLDALDELNGLYFERYTGNLDDGYDAIIEYISQNPYGPFLALPGNINYNYVGYYDEDGDFSSRQAAGHQPSHRTLGN